MTAFEFWAWVFAISVVVALVYGIIASINTSNRKKSMVDHLSRIGDFSATQTVIGNDGYTGLAIDEQRKKICLIDFKQQGPSTRVFGYKDLVSSEIFEDDTTTTKTVRSHQLGGALVGGLVGGRTGAVIGGLSATTQTSREVKKIHLRLTVNDTQAPIHDIKFLNLAGKGGIKTDSIGYKQYIQQARHWHGLIEVLIKRADLDDAAANADETKRRPSESIADELKKLSELRDAGVLSNDEFQQQKLRLLGA